jgi:hypothetical protein
MEIKAIAITIVTGSEIQVKFIFWGLVISDRENLPNEEFSCPGNCAKLHKMTRFVAATR